MEGAWGNARLVVLVVPTWGSSFSLQNHPKSQCMVHASDPRTGEVEPGSLLERGGQTAWQHQQALGQWEILSQKTSWIAPEEWHPRLSSRFQVYTSYAHMHTQSVLECTWVYMYLYKIHKITLGKFQEYSL